MKPDFLYHGSPYAGLDMLEPRAESPGHALSGTYVFATQYKPLAAMFLSPKIAPMQMGRFNEDYALIVACTQQAYARADKGGTIYKLPAATFQSGATDMPEVEWFSRVAVRPAEKEVYKSSLAAMRQCGVKVYFVDQATYDAVQLADDHGWAILQSLSPAAQ